MTIREFRAAWRDEALRRGINPRDVDVLLCDALGKNLAWLIAHDDEELVVAASVEAALQRRFSGEPLQYIRGRVEFYGREFLCDSRALIPRPETEVLVEEALKRTSGDAVLLDVGTGTGCIPITYKLERTSARVFASDISIAALSLARSNAARLQASVRLVAADVLQPMVKHFDIIVSNPPYISAEEVTTLATEVRDHEPYNALTPGGDGTKIIERLFVEARPLLREDGWLMFEMGYGQSDAARELAAKHDWEVVDIVNDLAAIPRVVVAKRRADL